MSRKTIQLYKSRETLGGRRSTEEVRELIVDAATRMFVERGYLNTTMRDVASAAGVGLSVLYRQFSNKERLFSTTLVAPFLTSFERFGMGRAGARSGSLSDEQLLNEFIDDLHRSVAAHRHTIITLLGVSENPDAELVGEVRARLDDAWRHLHLAAVPGMSATGARARMRDANMLVVAMIVGLVVFQPWISAIRRGKDAPLVRLASLFAAGGVNAVRGS